MDGQRRLWQAVTSARRSLNVEKVLIALQKGLLYAVLSITIIYLVTRFFVLPYYGSIGAVVATIAFVLPLGRVFWQRVKQREAMLRLDQFYPHNELVTVLTAKEHSPLVTLLQEKAEMQVGQVLEAFKKRPKQLFQSKVMTATAGLLVLFLVLTIFPAATQQEAKSIEEDRAITKDLKDKVKEQVEKPVPEETKKELAELQKAIEEAKTSEEALKELVKKQKELTNMEQQLVEEAKDGVTPDMHALGKVNTELAEAASEAQTSLSKLGKPVDLNTQKSIASMNRGDGQLSGDPSEASGQQNDSDSTATGQNNSTGTSSSNANNQGAANQNGANTNAGQQGSGQSGQGGQSGQQGSGNQQGSGQGAGQGGQGSQGSSGQGGNGGTGGQGGLMGGKGSGGRDLLAIPKRVGESNGTTTDGGLLGDGETVTERGPVPATKGEVRPYAEVIGTYEDSYMQSTDRLQLPSDLQQMVQNYYSSMEQ